MIKKIGIIVSAAAIMLTLSACNQKDEEYVTISDSTCDFSYEISADWTETSENGLLSAAVLKDVSKANVIGHSYRHGLEEEPSAIDYWNDHYKKQLMDTYKDIKVTSEKEVDFNKASDKAASEQKITRATYEVTIGKEKFDCDIMLAVYNGKVYTLTLTQGAKTKDMKDNYTDYSKEFDKMVKSFKIGGPIIK